MKDIDEYQHAARSTAVYPGIGFNLTYPALGLNGEAGEVAEKVKKILRDDNSNLSEDRRKAIMYELGDVMWYAAAIASELRCSMSEILKMNLDKLHKRKQEGNLKGDGDSR